MLRGDYYHRKRSPFPVISAIGTDLAQQTTEAVMQNSPLAHALLVDGRRTGDYVRPIGCIIQCLSRLKMQYFSRRRISLLSPYAFCMCS